MGPVTPIAFEGLIKDNVVRPDSLVWSAGQPDWLPFSQVAADTAVCAASGGRYWRRDMVPYEGKFISAEHKEKFFQRLQEGVQQPGQMVYAEFGTRFAAKLIDGVINWIMGTCASLLLAFAFFGSFLFQPKVGDAGSPGRFLAFQGANMLLGIAIGLTYYCFFLKKYAATPGKMALGIKIVRSDGGPLSFGRIIGRYFSEIISTMILMIGYIMAGFDDERRALHDRICDTRVIKAR